jgi:fibro-slime domain-containing protein
MMSVINKNISDESGFTLVISLIIMFTIAILGIGMIFRSSIAKSLEYNQVARLQSFYTSDAVMTILAQELHDNKFELYKSPLLLMEDNFARKESNSIGNLWDEFKNDFDNHTTLREGLMLFKSISTSNMAPLVKRKFTEQKNGHIIWNFDLNWSATHDDAMYEFLMQMGNNMSNDDMFKNVAVSLRWGDDKAPGFNKNESFGYNNRHNGRQLAVIDKKSRIKVDANLNNKKYNISIDGRSVASNISFVNNVPAINEIRFFCNKLSSCKFNGLSIDNVIVYNNNLTDSTYTDTFSLGDHSIAWAVDCKDFDKYILRTNAWRNNSVIHSRIHQELNVQPPPDFEQFPDEIKVPVRFYDFHSDRSNIEFEQPFNWEQPMLNMVAQNLNPDAKPLNGPTCFLNYYLKYWFIDSKTIPATDVVYKYPTNCDLINKCAGPLGTWTDEYHITSTIPDFSTPPLKAQQVFSNMIIDTFLVFKHQGSGTYEFRDDSFFYLDKKGFGPEWHADNGCYGFTEGIGHNFSYTMEIHRPFMKTSGLVFDFKGDDDVWAFINDNLVLDIGGIHGPQPGKVKVDDIPNLKDNTMYNFDFFYCERHSRASSIWISTNMLQSRPPFKPKKYWRRDYGRFF